MRNELYLFSDSQSKIKLVVLCIFVLVSLIAEFIYRQSLYSASLRIQTALISKITPFTMKLCNFFSLFGTVFLLIPTILTFLFFPANSFFSLIAVLFKTDFFCNFLKIIYGSPRPFWTEPRLKLKCEGSYGNPSSHSFSCFGFYFAFTHILVNSEVIRRNKRRKLIQFCAFFGCAALCLCVVASRVLLNVHSLNQVLHGAILGLSVYSYYFFILKINSFLGKEFSDLLLNTKILLINSIKFASYLMLLVLFYFIIHHKEDEKYKEFLMKECSTLSENKMFNKHALSNGLHIFLLIGSYYGYYFLFKISKIYRPFKENEINNWNKNACEKLIPKFLCFLVCLLPLVVSNLFGGNIGFGGYLLLKVIIPYFSIGMLTSIFYLFIMIKFKWANTKIFDNFRIGTEAEINYLKCKKITTC